MILRDPVHGLVVFEREEEAILERLLATREVQRLRRIRQLGLTSLAFPGAEHTRFAHAIGAAHVMQLFVARFRQVEGDLPFWHRVTSERARDALAAALLHDVGHGPLSHLFESAVPWPPADEREGAGGGPRAAHHESWTEQVILDASSEVNRVLVADDPSLPRRIADLVAGRHELPYLARSVSGTFDVDRCDYLLRDAHATGVRYGEYDLPWLLRSLSIAPTPAGPGLAIDGTKGTSAFESFILARHFMFQQVYFHKATRAAEWMIGAILRRAVERLRDGDRLAGTPAAITSIAAGETPTLGQYLELDDQVLLGAIRAWEDARDPVLSDLSRRLRSRSLFKAIELLSDAPSPRPDGDGSGGGSEEASRRVDRVDERAKQHETMIRTALETAREVARAAGFDPDVHVGLDVARDTPYSDAEAMAVVFPRGRTRRPREVSFLLERLDGETVARTRILFVPELRDAMREALLEKPGA